MGKWVKCSDSRTESAVSQPSSCGGRDYGALAAAILLQAWHDLSYCPKPAGKRCWGCNAIGRGPHCEARRFWRSRWCELLCDACGITLTAMHAAVDRRIHEGDSTCLHDRDTHLPRLDMSGVRQRDVVGD